MITESHNPHRVLQLVFMLSLTLAGVAHAKQADLPAYPYLKHLVPEEDARQSLGAFPLDSDVFAETRNDYANLRIVNDSGTEIPYRVRTRTEAVTSTHDTVIPTRVESLRELPGNKIEIEILATGEPKESQEIVLSTRQHNFEKLATVYGTVDGQNWREIATEVPLVDYSRFIAYQKTRVVFAPAKYKRLRITLTDVTVDRELPLKKSVREALQGAMQHEFIETSFQREDFHIDHIRILGTKTTTTGSRSVARKRSIPDFKVQQDKRLTVIEFTAKREPVAGIMLQTSGINFSRPVTIEGKSEVGDGNFKMLHHGTYSHISVGDVKHDRRTLHLPSPSRCAAWRITINNRDNPSLEITGISLEEECVEAVFVNTPASSYRAFYGGKQATLPRYDVAAILNAVGRTPVAEFRLGDELQNPQYKRTRGGRLHIGGQAILTIAILLMVGALGWGVAVAAKKVDLTNIDEKSK